MLLLEIKRRIGDIGGDRPSLEISMATLEVDFEVFKALTLRRKTEAMTYNDVIRELLEMTPTTPTPGAMEEPGWIQKGVVFPNGTKFRAIYKGVTYTAEIRSGRLWLNDQPMNSLSEAATQITQTTVNGWRFWHCRLPNSSAYVLADTLKR
jgi:hypothetical protein